MDIYRKTVDIEENFIQFALYIAFFPQVIAGPIESHRKFMPQINEIRKWSSHYFQSAWPLLVMGFFKKIVIADNIKIIVDKIYLLEQPSKFLLIVGTLAFTLQILMDFSAYTDLSRGLAYLLGLETSKNFQNPYLALTPTQFWDRWHITLSDWLRDYIFFPLRRHAMRAYRKRYQYFAILIPPIIAMLVSGLWHGADWPFLTWGLLHGLLIVGYQALGMGGSWQPKSWIQTFAAWIIMFSFIVFSWMFFRAPSVSWLMDVIIHSPWVKESYDLYAGLVGLSLTAFYAFPLLVKLLLDRFFSKSPWLQGLYFAAVTMLTVVYLNSSSPDFIYAQF